MREGHRNLGSQTTSPVFPALFLGGGQPLSWVEEKQLKARSLARLKPESPLRKEDQDRRGDLVTAMLQWKEALGPPPWSHRGQ